MSFIRIKTLNEMILNNCDYCTKLSATIQEELHLRGN